MHTFKLVFIYLQELFNLNETFSMISSIDDTEYGQIDIEDD